MSAPDAEFIVALANALAQFDGIDVNDPHSGLFDLRWAGGPEPYPLGDAWSMDYEPKARRIAEILAAAPPAPTVVGPFNLYTSPMKSPSECIASCDSGEPCDTQRCPLPEAAPPAPQQVGDEVLGVAQAIEQLRAVKIAEAVAGLAPHYVADSEFRNGYETACDEILHRLRTEQWSELCLPPVAAPPEPQP